MESNRFNLTPHHVRLKEAYKTWVKSQVTTEQRKRYGKLNRVAENCFSKLQTAERVAEHKGGRAANLKLLTMQDLHSRAKIAREHYLKEQGLEVYYVYDRDSGGFTWKLEQVTS